jgi:mutator protein MutT
MQHTTLLYLIKEKDGKISEICLAMKKRSFGVGRWNGVGGKVDIGETLSDAVVRETIEEINVTPRNFSKKAELVFIFPHQLEWNQIVNVYFCVEWEGEPTESEEMKPEWFSVMNLPYKNMWPDDPFWLPHLINGKILKGNFILSENDTALEHSIEEVDEVAFI